MIIFKAFLLVTLFATISPFSISHRLQPKDRKLFGGYRITPKKCQPTNPPRTKSEAPAICMFNDECSRRRGEVVGACMDGFLFGACCQLPDKQTYDSLQKLSYPGDSIVNVHEIDHVPDVPILLNSEGMPVDSLTHRTTTLNDIISSTKSSYIGNYNDNYEHLNKLQLNKFSELEDKYSTLLEHDQVLDGLKLPTLISHVNAGNNGQAQTSPGINPVTTLVNADQIVQVVDPVDQLAALFSHGLNQNNNTLAETILLSQNGSALHEYFNPDEHFKPSSAGSSKVPTTQVPTKTYASKSQTKLPTRVSTQKITPANKTTNKKTTMKVKTDAQNYKNSNFTKSSLHTKSTTSSFSKEAARNKTSISGEATTPISLTTRSEDELLRMPLITYGTHSGNKKDDVLDKEEIAINHIISILNDTNDAKLTTRVSAGPTTYKWITTDDSLTPMLVKVTTTHPPSGSTKPFTQYPNSAAPSNYYYYNTVVTEPSSSSSSHKTPSILTNSYSTQPATISGSTNDYVYTSRPTKNPPAPTVIVLGPLGTEYTTNPTDTTPSRINTNNYKPSSTGTKLPANTIIPSIVTKNPDVATTLTHNISTYISGNKQVLSVSYISVNLKDGTTLKPVILSENLQPTDENNSNDKISTKRPSTVYTALTSWSEKPSFHLKPPISNYNWVDDNQNEYISDQVTRPGLTTTGLNCEEDTAASDDVNNFPPVRHPELDSTVTHLQDKPTVVEPGEVLSEDEIPTPSFVEDAELNNKVDVFVNKIVESLQGNFQNLKDVVYNPKNATISTPASSITKRPVSSTTTRRPATRPIIKVTKRPVTNRLTTTQKVPPTKAKPTAVSTRKPISTKRPKPIKKITTTISDVELSPNFQETTSGKPIDTTTAIPEITPNADFRSICGIRPLTKTGRIVGGKGATFGEWPWQVLVREATWLGLFTKNKCGGVLITDKYVITAAHCQPGFLASLVAVFGEFDISGELESRRSVTRNVRKVIVHRSYDPATFENDLALLELETPIQFDAHIIPICMPDDNTDYVNRMATVTGWGRLKYNGGVPSVLQEVKVPIMENSVCQEMFQTAGHSKLILESFMCAGYSNGQKDSCEGDSGGPLTLQRPDGRWILVGTVSHGIKCAAPFLPGVYMRTTFFKNWLKTITGV